tara:strand:- start:2931 stop:3098 length:168 start_codon:yes stop_codon:yes gene_type:complete
MHPREKVLGLARLLFEKGYSLPEELVEKADVYGVDVTDFQIQQQPKEPILEKENN